MVKSAREDQGLLKIETDRSLISAPNKTYIEKREDETSQEEEEDHVA